MPPSINRTTKPGSNGHPSVGPDNPGKNSGLAARIEQGTDLIKIGGSMEVDNDLTTATMADAASEIESVKYLVRNWIPYGMITALVAEPGVGKSAFALWIARTIMTGLAWFTGLKGPKPGYVLWCATENDMALTKSRMELWNIPMGRLLLPFKDDVLGSVDLQNVNHLARVEQLINRYKPRAVIVDSLRGGHAADENSSSVGRILKNLAAIAERTNVAIIVVHHTKKLEPGEDVTANSSRGSNAILALFRAQLGFDRPDPDSDMIRVRMLKQNLGLAPKPIGMRITASGIEFGEAPTKPEKETQKSKAIDWLQGHMADGEWYPSRTVLDDAVQFGYSANAIQRAREELGITQESGYVRKRPADNLYEWKLPGSNGKT